jgi:hypothetical protein
VQAWNTVTGFLRDQRGSPGSRLHRGEDGLWYSYARWPSAQAREAAFASARPQTIVDAGAHMCAAIAQELPEVVLQLKSDYFCFRRTRYSVVSMRFFRPKWLEKLMGSARTGCKGIVNSYD